MTVHAPATVEVLPARGRARRFRTVEGVELHRLSREEEALVLRIAKLGRENVFGVVASGTDDDGAWFTLAPDESTLEVELERACSPSFGRTIFEDLARALAACERAAIFPGALHPREIGIFRGRAHLRATSLLDAWLGRSRETPKVEGPSRWDSPEVRDGAPRDSAANRYALGLIVYRVLSGNHPFSGLGLRHAQKAAETDPPPFADELASTLEPGLQSLVLALLSPPISGRPRSAAELVERLRGLSSADGRGPSARSTSRPRTGAPESARPHGPDQSRSPLEKEPARAKARFTVPSVRVLIPMVVGLLGVGAALAAPRRDEAPKAEPPKAKPLTPLSKARARDCAPCHAREVSEWERSVMAHAAKSPLFGALESMIEEQNGRDLRCPNGAGFLRKRGADSCVDEKSGVVETGAGGEHWCVNCHAPTEAQSPSVPAWTALGSSKGRAPLVDLLGEEALEGISCASCHETVGPVEAHGASARYEGNATWTSVQSGAVFLSRPEDGQGRPGISNSGYRIEPSALLGATGPARAGDPVVHRRSDGQATAYRRTSEFCGTCHDVRLFGTDVIGKERGEHFKRLRNGYSEWRAWAEGETARGRRASTCQDCHMSLYPGVCLPGAAPAGGADNRVQNGGCPSGTHFEARAPGEYPVGLVTPGSEKKQSLFSHFFSSVDVPLTRAFPDGYADERGTDARGTPLGLRSRRDLLLRHTFRFELGVARREGARLEIPVTLENVGAGHRVPAGFSQEREVWIELRVKDARGNLVYEVGHLDDPAADLPDKRFVRVNVRDDLGTSGAGGGFLGRFESRGPRADGKPLGVFGADIVDGPDVPDWSPNPRFGGTRFRGKGLVNLQNGFLRCVKCIGFVDARGKCQPGPGQGRTRADRYDDAPYDVDTGECRSNLSGGEELFETYFPLGSLDADRGVLKAPDAIVDTRSAPPGVPLEYTYVVESGGRPGPFTVEARLKFRSFPPFLVRAFADYEAERARRGERPSGPQVTLDMLRRIDVVDLAEASTRIE